MQAGIYGSPDLGTYSIIVAGTYDDIDIDSGDRLFYSTAGSHETTSTTPDVNNSGTKALLASVANHNPVRVLRSYTGRWKYAPQAGLRYDGLYMVNDHYEKENSKGGKYFQFVLERMGGQPPIDVTKPTMDQMRLFKQVARGY